MLNKAHQGKPFTVVHFTMILSRKAYKDTSTPATYIACYTFCLIVFINRNFFRLRFIKKV